MSTNLLKKYSRSQTQKKPHTIERSQNGKFKISEIYCTNIAETALIEDVGQKLKLPKWPVIYELNGTAKIEDSNKKPNLCKSDLYSADLMEDLINNLSNDLQ